MSSLSLSLLGPFQAEINGRPQRKFRTNKVQALLIYLTVENSGPVRRDTLMGLLWPDLPRRSAQRNLRQTVFQLRKLLPQVPSKDGEGTVPFALSERQTVSIHPKAAYTLDVAEFTQLLQETRRHTHPDLAACPACRERLEQAITLYRGDFLADFYLADSNIFEEWAMMNRETFRRQALDALETVATVHLLQGNYREAQGLARRQIELDDLREVGYQQLMESLARDDQRNAALVQYEACRQRLDEELGIAPTASTTRLYSQIKAGELGLAPVQPEKIRGYELLEEIGAGAFGAVHRAYQPAVGRQVAVKIILPQYVNHPDFIRRFEAEAHVVARLEHPHIVPLYDYWRDPDGAYLVMRLLRGGNLEKLLQQGPVALDTAVTFVDQIASALAVAHRHGIIHRDLKPANILLDEEGNVYLSDFGIARDLAAEQHLTEAGAVLGSAEYISPEQVLEEPITPMTDIYSLGVILYTLLAGQRPFPGASLVALMQKHLHEPLPSIQEQNSAVPSQVDQVIQQATAKPPEQRYVDVLTMAHAFRDAVSQAGVSGLPSLPAAIMAAGTDADLANPYKGLRSFQEADSDHFFGRESLVRQLVARLTGPGDPASPIRRRVDAPGRFLAIVGPSGSGKSSVVKAGLIPAIRQDALPGSENWFIVEMTPGAHPLEELEAALLHIAVNPPPSLIEPLQRDERGLVRTVKRILPRDQEDERPSELLLLIDQFEELFTLVEDEAVRNHFMDSLATAVSDPRSRLRVIVTLRADFYDRPLQHAGLGELLRHHTEVVLPLTPGELEQAISGPAQRVGVTPEPGLIAAITADVNEQPGALPLLQYALTELFERRDGRSMTWVAYEKIGGVSGALGRRAEESYQSLDKAGQEAARQFFLRLVTLGEGIEDTRRRVLRSELAAMQTFDEKSDVLDKVIDIFGQYRLLSFDRDPVARAPTVEVAHEALLHEWGRLREWLDEGRDDVRWQRRLAAATTDWLQAGRDDGFLLRRSQLDQFAGWAAGTQIALTQDEQAFLDSSVKVRETREAKEDRRRQRELETARQLAATEQARAEDQSQAAQRLRRRAMYLWGALALAVLFAIAAGLFGQRSQQNANLAGTREAEAITSAELAAEAAAAKATAAAEAQIHQAIAEANAREALEAYSQSLAGHAQNSLEKGDTATGLVLALAANNIDQPPELSQRLLRQAAYAPGPRHQYLVAETFADTTGRVYSLDMSPVARTVLVGLEDGTLILWDLESESEIHRLVGHTDLVRTVAFSPDGGMALSGGNDRTVILWDLATGQAIRRLEGHAGWVRAVAFSPDGGQAVSGGLVGDEVSAVVNPGELILWDLETGREIRRFGGESAGHPSGVQAIAFSPDGGAVLVSSGFFIDVEVVYSLTLWEVETGERIHDFDVAGLYDNYGVAISPDGSTALTGTSEGMVAVWDLGTGEQIMTLEGNAGRLVTSVAYTPDGRRALSGDADGWLILWDLESGTPLMRAKTQEPSVGGWHVDDDPVLNLALSSDGRTALSTAGDGTLVLWELVDAGEIRRLEGHQSPVGGVAITPDGKYALTGAVGSGGGFYFSEDNSMRLWDVATGEQIRVFEGHTAGVAQIAVSADGRRALSGSLDGSMRLWNLETGDELRSFRGYPDGVGVFSVAYSPDGRTGLSGSATDDSMILWDLESGEIIHRVVTGSNFTKLFYSPDGHTAYYEMGDGLVLLDLETGQQIQRFSIVQSCTGFAIHPDGRSAFVANNQDGLLRQWDLEEDQLIRIWGQYDGGRTRVEASQDGRTMLVITSENDLSLWDLDTGQVIRRFKGDGWYGFDIDMSPDGHMAISPGANGTAILWNLGLPSSLDDVRQWITDNRYVRQLTCEERQQYRIEPLCSE